MQNSDLIVTYDGNVARVAIVRPETRNALRRETLEQLRAAIAGLSARADVRAMVLTGCDRSFCSGADLADPMMGGHLPPQERGEACAAVLDGLMHALIRDVRNAPFPVVVAVNGVAAGGGVGLALAGDIVIAARSARFVLTFTPKLGLVPDLGTSWQLARTLGRARALGVLLTGTPVSAEQALDWGLIWSVAEDDALEEQAMEVAARLAAGPVAGQVATRRLLDGAFVNDLDAQLDAERDAQASLVGGAEVVEAMEAFAQRRTPEFLAVVRPDVS
ncbi:enoyl-CoA hydratase-related protein [Aquibium sp. LZ166]|uniref:Enoyl-CoA hydratase-related protein n=1 Tax=Aquibium pacificus TaxID=3153579 RepID=A0ABV3SS75_9HYPH